MDGGSDAKIWGVEERISEEMKKKKKDRNKRDVSL